MIEGSICAAARRPERFLPSAFSRPELDDERVAEARDTAVQLICRRPDSEVTPGLRPASIVR
jgi:hypothetical protein